MVEVIDGLDIVYIPMQRGFVYLVAIIDRHNRKVVVLTVWLSMSVGFCLKAVEEALAKRGKPAIFNTGQGSQFTSAAFSGLLADHGIAISVDGKGSEGSWRDNVFVERLWRSVK